MLKIFIPLYVLTIGFCYATTNCHDLQKSQLASLNDRITQMLNSLYTSPLSSKTSTSPVSSSSNDTPTNDYASNPYESNYYTYPPFAVPPQVIYVTPSQSSGIYGTPPAVYAPPPVTYAAPPPTYASPTSTYAPSPALIVPPTAIPAIPPTMAALPQAIYTPPVMAAPVPHPIGPPPTPSPFYHLEPKEQPFDPYRDIPTAPKSPWHQYYENYQYRPLRYSSTASTPYSPSYPPTFPYSSDYNSPYSEFSTSLHYPPKSTYSPLSPAYLPPQGYLPPGPIQYPQIYPKRYEMPPPPYYA